MCRTSSVPVHRLCTLSDCSVHTDCVTQHCKQSTELSSSPGCCTLPAPGGASPRPQTGSASRDFYAVVCVPVTAERTSRRPPSWSKTKMTSCSTGSSMSAATFCSHCFLIVALTLMHCEIGVMTFYYLFLFNSVAWSRIRNCFISYCV